MKNQVQLITYVDRLSGGGFKHLKTLLNTQLAGLFGGVHVLPFFDPIDGSDAGFDPKDHTSVDPRLGSWEDVNALADDVEVMADLIVNHISEESPQFKAFQNDPPHSPYRDLFLTLDRVFPKGASGADLLAIYRPRPGLPFSVKTLGNGQRELLWTTFTPAQLDIDVQSPAGRAYLRAILDQFQRAHIKHIRLDAAGYAIKKPGTSCFMLPETFAFIGELTREAHARGMEVLVEIHAYYQTQNQIAQNVDWVYDFALPPLILHALMRQSSQALSHWLAIRPRNALTVLDTHDGIGIIDIGGDATDRATLPGLVPDEELSQLVDWIHDNARGQSRLATGAAASNLDLYQINCTFYDALGAQDERYLLARAVQFFVPGIPQVYYVGLLAGLNDLELLAKTQVGRDINRHYYTPEEIHAACALPVVQKLFELIRLRNHHPAFQGTFHSEAPSPTSLILHWQWQAHYARLMVDFKDAHYTLETSQSPN